MQIPPLRSEVVTFLIRAKMIAVDGEAGCRLKRRPAPTTAFSFSTTLSYLSSRPERSGGEGSAVRHSGAPHLPFYNHFLLCHLGEADPSRLLRLVEHISRKGPRNRRSLGFAPG
jgi:hypothetical protein